MTEEETKDAARHSWTSASKTSRRSSSVAGRNSRDDQAALDAATTGQIFTAKQALDHGLVDKIGFIEAAIARATQLADESPKNVRCVKYEKQPSLFGEFVGVRFAHRTGTRQR